ncbi:hypothetical protein COO60DRAFT_1462321 [Scenedesmus sp. NREL 46B-D3]|nr:hypothetical protein COO60DRAFT_1462321 [Scenedesmus sp. NREL 46B-D3]
MTALVESMASHFGKELTLYYIRQQPRLLNLDFDTVLNRCSSIQEMLGIRDSDIPQMLRKCPSCCWSTAKQSRLRTTTSPAWSASHQRWLTTPPVTTRAQRLANSVERLRQLCYTREEWASDFEAISPGLLAYFLRDATDQLMRLEYLASTGCHCRAVLSCILLLCGQQDVDRAHLPGLVLVLLLGKVPAVNACWMGGFIRPLTGAGGALPAKRGDEAQTCQLDPIHHAACMQMQRLDYHDNRMQQYNLN